MKRKTALILAALLLAGLLASCSPTATDPTDPTSATDPPGSGGTTAATEAPTQPPAGEPSGSQDIMVCVGPDPETLDPGLNSSVDGSIVLVNAFSGLYGFQEVNGVTEIVPDCAEALVEPTPLGGDDEGKYEYVLTLKEGLKWSDGEPLLASHFTYAWNRAVDPATGADYQYIFDVIDGYDDTAPILNIAADDAARTVTVVTAAYCAYFDQLLAFPTYFPVRPDIVDANPDAWATNPATYISNGAFKMVQWDVGSAIRFEKNENYWDAGSVKLNSITYALSEDDDAKFANFENGTYQYVDSVPISQIPTLKANRLGKDFFITDYIGTYWLEFNVEVSFKPGLTSANDDAASWTDWTPEQNAQVRRALSLLIDRNYIVTEITQAGQIPAYGLVPTGMDDGTGAEFRSKAKPWWSTAEADYDANCDEAVEILRQYYDYDEGSGKFTNFPAFEYSVNPSTGNVAMAEAIQSIWIDYGISCTLDQRTWSVIQTALTAGDFTMSRLGWIADYNDPINFLEIYVGASGNNHPRLGKDGPIGSGAYYGMNGDQTWADAYETLIKGIKTEADRSKRADLMYQAEEVFMNTYAIAPLYYYTKSFLCHENLKDYIRSPLGWISYKYAYWAG